MTTIERIIDDWESDRWNGIRREYSPADVLKLRCPADAVIDTPYAKYAAEKFWNLLQQEPFTAALGALTGLQAVQYDQGGLKAIYLSGWQVAADANLAGETYPDQSLYPVNSVPALVKRINNAFKRAAEIEHSQGRPVKDWFAPIVADAEAGFGGPVHAYELMKQMIHAGAAAVHYEDQLAAAKKCGHMGGKVLIPTQDAIRNLTGARLAADVLGVPTVIIARTDANSANLITSDVDERDRHFLTGSRTPEGFFELKGGKGGLDMAIARGLAYAPYADLLWCETSTPDLGEAKRFAEAVHREFPGKLLAYNCSPSFNWKKKYPGKEGDRVIGNFQRKLAAMGYKYQFITLAGFHALNLASFELAKGFAETGMSAYVRLQQQEFAAEKDGYQATEHQRFVGTKYFDAVNEVISGGKSSTLAMTGSTADQFGHDDGHTMPPARGEDAPLLKHDTPTPHRHEDEIR